MITKITGKLLAVAEEAATLEVDAFEYEVLIPEFNRRQLQSRQGQQVSFFTIHYLDGNPAHGRLTPRIVGFLREVEREFFEMICSVDGVGVKKALRAMVRPVQDVAIMIEEQDAKGLSTLPGVGGATAERIIAKLRRKMPKFALLVGRDDVDTGEVRRDVVEDTFRALLTLGHNESEYI
ncbi:MAG: Holliday junction branch migration protein RuvA [Pirellulaceae bacterium]